MTEMMDVFSRETEAFLTISLQAFRFKAFLTIQNEIF